MTILTSKVLNDLYAIQLDAVHDADLHRFVRMTVRGIYVTSEDFGSRKALQTYVDTLRDLVDARMKKEDPCASSENPLAR